MSATEKPVVLIVDDKEEFRTYAKTEFEKFGYVVDTAANYASAVRAIDKQKEIMVAFIDIHLQKQGGGNGFDLLRHIVNTASHRVVPYAWTGDESLLVETEAMDAGALRVFYKGKDPIERLLLSAKSHALRLVRESGVDDKTGLDNFQSFRRSVLAEFRRSQNLKDPRRASRFCFLFCDLDDFGEINKKHGDSVGDLVLKSVAAVLRRNVRASDHPCRKGGDEFVICMPNVDLGKATEVGNKIEDAIADEVVLTSTGEKVSVSVSIGVHDVEATQIANSEPEIVFGLVMDRADEEMRETKRFKKSLND